MPFEPTNQFPSSPRVHIYMTGLLMVSSAADSGKMVCEIRAVSHGGEHEFCLDVITDEPQPNRPFLTLRKQDLAKGIEIATAQPKGVTKFDPPSAPPKAPFGLSEAFDFKTEHPNAHPNHNGAEKGVVTIRDGVLCNEARPERARLESPTTRKCRDVLAGILGIRIETNEVSIRLNGAELQKLPRGIDNPDMKYIIWISNSRPIPADANDFHHLYGAISGVNDQERWKCEFLKCRENPPPIRIRDTPRIPCIPGVFDA